MTKFRRSLQVRLLFLLLLTIIPASALPDREEARRLLGSPIFEERETVTLRFWEAGPAALPLLKELITDTDPEIAARARFVFKRLRMGLGPNTPDDLLKLATLADQAPFERRSSKLGDLLEHDQGFPAGLFFLNQWLSNKAAHRDHRISLTEIFVESLLEQRKHWQQFFTFPFSAAARATLIGTLSIQETTLKERMIAILAKTDLRDVHENLIGDFEFLPDETHLTLARLAVLQNDLDLALQTLAHGLSTSESPDLARAIAFLEKTAELPLYSYKGPWLRELQLFRARADRNHSKTARLAALVKNNAALKFESNLLAGELSLPDKKDAGFLVGTESLPAWNLAFGSPPEEPDIEALTSSVLIDWPVLSRTLTALGHPLEAAERLSSEDQITSAIGLLWRTGHREKALALANEILNGADNSQQTFVRLTLTSLFLNAGEKEKAAEIFKPLTHPNLRLEKTRHRAIPLAIRLFPLEKATTFERSLRNGRSFHRQRAVIPFLEFPPMVSGYWYEHFYDPKSEKTPATMIKEVRQFLTNQLPEAREIISAALANTTKPTHRSNDALFQNALFLKIPEALELAKRSAWHQLETKNLLTIIRSEEWPHESRLKALASAIGLDPTDPTLRWYDHQLNSDGNLKTITLATLGDPTIAFTLARLTGKRETLATTARIADFRNPATSTCLEIVGKSHLKNNEPVIASRLLLASLLGKIIIGTRDGSSIQNTLDTLSDLFRARLQSAGSEDEKAIWQERLVGLGQKP